MLQRKRRVVVVAEAVVRRHRVSRRPGDHLLTDRLVRVGRPSRLRLTLDLALASLRGRAIGIVDRAEELASRTLRLGHEAVVMEVKRWPVQFEPATAFLFLAWRSG